MSPGEDLVVDSGAISNMIKDRDIFVSLDENFKGSVSNANFSESKIIGKDEVRIREEDEEGEFNMIELKDTLYVPETSRNLLSVSKIKKAGAEVVFGASSFVRFWCELACSKWFSLPIKRGKWSLFMGHFCRKRRVLCS